MNTTRTPSGAMIHLAQLFNKEPAIAQHSTLNQKFNVEADETLNMGEVPHAGYICIGNAGHTAAVENNITSIKGVPRLSLAAALYNHMPFVIRPVTDDLSETERAPYRMRVIEVHGGVSYAAYYLKAFHHSIVNITSDYTPDASHLDPQHPTTTNSNVLATVAEIPFVLSASEIDNIKEAQQLIHGVEGFATISEIGLVTGVDRDVSVDIDGTAVTYTECIAAQLHSSSNAGRLLDFTQSVSTPTTLTVGTLDPLITT